MTIAETGKQIDGLIQEHHVYGAETIINGLVRASLKVPYLEEDQIIKMIRSAFKREEDRKHGNNFFEKLKTEERIQKLIEIMTNHDFTAESLLTEIFRFMDPVDIELMLTCIIMKHTEIPLEEIPTK